MAGKIQDDRTPEEKAATIGFMIAHDKFLSGWGEAANGRSIVACPITSGEDADRVEKRFRLRNELKRVRYIAGSRCTVRLHEGDHLHIYNTTTSFRYAI